MASAGKVYCNKCRKTLDQVLSSFECLANWNKEENYYAPGDSCLLVKRCPACGNPVKDRAIRIAKKKINIEEISTPGSSGRFARSRTKGAARGKSRV